MRGFLRLFRVLRFCGECATSTYRVAQEHPELKLTIVGHTDNVGGAAFNQSLSEKRAQAVREFLVSTYAVEPSRLAAKGMGATKPVASNDTPEGRQNNRRVELVKS